ncbi:hypothetical protein MKW98_023949, partial [Papaver atlanticum]
ILNNEALYNAPGGEIRVRFNWMHGLGKDAWKVISTSYEQELSHLNPSVASFVTFIRGAMVHVNHKPWEGRPVVERGEFAKWLKAKVSSFRSLPL